MSEKQCIGFATHIRPLFRQRDIDSMGHVFDLSSYEDVNDNADSIYERLSDGTMPCDGAWPDEDVALFRRWIDEGMLA